MEHTDIFTACIEHEELVPGFVDGQESERAGNERDVGQSRADFVFGDDLKGTVRQAGSLPHDRDAAGVAISGVEPGAICRELKSDRPSELGGEVATVGGGRHGQKKEEQAYRSTKPQQNGGGNSHG